jgi:hypothetical protein
MKDLKSNYERQKEIKEERSDKEVRIESSGWV